VAIRPDPVPGSRGRVRQPPGRHKKTAGAIAPAAAPAALTVPTRGAFSGAPEIAAAGEAAPGRDRGPAAPLRTPDRPAARAGRGPATHRLAEMPLRLRGIPPCLPEENAPDFTEPAGGPGNPARSFAPSRRADVCRCPRPGWACGGFPAGRAVAPRSGRRSTPIAASRDTPTGVPSPTGRPEPSRGAWPVREANPGGRSPPVHPGRPDLAESLPRAWRAEPAFPATSPGGSRAHARRAARHAIAA
jgi:hypothetical protein